MARQTIDFHGIVNLDQSLVEQFHLYLEEKESHLSQILANAVQTQVDMETPSLPVAFKSHFKLIEGIEALSRKIRQAAGSSKAVLPSDDWQRVAGLINTALWEYVESLEGGVVELFQQLEQVGFERWRQELIRVVESIKEILMHSMEDVIWAIKRLETQLREYQAVCETKEKPAVFLSRLMNRWKPLLDRSLLSNIEKSKKYLRMRYQKFIHRYEQYQVLNGKIETSCLKFIGYFVLNSFDHQEQLKFQEIYSLLKLWEMNRKSKILPLREPVRALRSAVSPEKAIHFFRDYYIALKNKLLEQSRMIKADPQEMSSSVKMLEILGSIPMSRLELHTLGATIAKYRDFLLRTDSNPYVRARWGFTEWVVGPEPAQAKHLQSMVYDVESLESLFIKFEQSLQKGAEQPSRAPVILQGIHKALHEMGQPLISAAMMRTRCERLVGMLQELDELGSFDANIVAEIGQLLSKAMRADWKYNILHEIAGFQQIYGIHMGLTGHFEDRNHLNRINKFKRLTQQIGQWVKEKKTLKHLHDIELDMNDIRGYLQDFLAYVQRTQKDRNLFYKENAAQVIKDLSHQLLAYRYLFGHFFHQLRDSQADEKMLRNQFLFVDQYFEYIDNKLQDMRNMEWPEQEERNDEGGRQKDEE